MKLITTLFLTLSVLDVATPALAAEQVKRAVDCNDCNNRYQFCFKNGRSEGQEGCAKTCADHVCYQTPECRSCGGELSACLEVSRFLSGCGGKPCPGHG